MSRYVGFFRSFGLPLSLYVVWFLAVAPGGVLSAGDANRDPALYDYYKALLRLRVENRHDEILSGMQEIIQRDPTFWRAYQKIAESSKAKKDLDFAIHYFRGLLAENPQNLYAHYGLGLAYSGQEDLWLENLGRSFTIDPEFVLIHETLYSVTFGGTGKPKIQGLLRSNIPKHPRSPALPYALGLVYFLQSDWDHSLESLDTAIELRPDLIEAYVGKAHVYTAKRDAQGLMKAASAGLLLARNLNDLEYAEFFLGSLAQGYYLRADFLTALRYYEEALAITIELGAKDAERKYRGDIGAIHIELNNYTEALSSLSHALDISHQIRSDSERIHRSNIGLLYARVGQYDKALEYFNAAITLSQQLINKATVPSAKVRYEKSKASNLFNISDAVYVPLNDFPRALEHLTQAQKIAEKIGDKRLEGFIILSTGSAELGRNNIQKAISCFKRGLELARSNGMPRLEASALVRLGQANLKRGDYSAALDNYKQAMVIGKNTKTPWTHWTARVGLGSVYEKQRGLDMARKEYESAIEAIESVRANLVDDDQRASFLNIKLEPYEKIINLLATLHRLSPSKGYDKQAFHYVEKAKARTISDILQGSASSFDLPETPTDLATIQKELDNDTLLLEFFLSKDVALGFAVSHQSHKMFTLPRAELDDLAKRFQDSAKEPANYSAYLTYTRTAHKLYNCLIKPAEGLLKGKTHIVAVADGSLHYIPLAALLDRPAAATDGIDFTSLPYLIRKYAISYAPSAAVLKLLKEKESSSALTQRVSFLGISANPSDNYFKQNGYLNGALLYSKAEVTEIANLYPSSSIIQDPTADAVLDKLKSTADYKGIHFAVCGVLLGNKPALDLNCSSNPKSRSYLHLNDILTLKLNADLVVLSACQTGLGQDKKGEGLMGFSRAFLHAGAASVMVTLWQISDKTSPQLMVNFHRHMSRIHNTKAEALRRATLELLKSKQAHPFYWAAFVLVGS